MEQDISFGTWLRKQRRALDLTRQAFADQVGCAEVTLRRIEAGSLKPSKELASILLEKLGIPEADRSSWLSFVRGLSGFPSKSVPSSNKPKSNLPAPITTFIGREKQQLEIIQLITKHRLVTLTGSGGVGKTRLSIKVGEQVLGNYADGVWLLELASLSDPTLLPQTAAALFGITTQSNIPFTDLLVNFLRAKSVLLILDNCEHLLEVCAYFAATVLQNCPYLKILTTSREPLGIIGEAIYVVPSLALPDLQHLLSTFKEFEAVRLFEERTQLVQFDFSLTMKNASSVVQICHRLDGIPLAIELAAVKVGMFSTEQIAKQLNESFNLLTGGSRTALPRHQTLRASMNWSWSLLTEPEQMLMRGLSVFVGGWALEAAQAVCDGDVLELINSLVKKSLIVMKQPAGRETRYYFHEAIRQYANEKLIGLGESDILRDRHLECFLNLAERAKPYLTRGAHDLDWLNRIESEHDNMRAALVWSQETHEFEIGARIAFALTGFWETSGYLQEGRKWLESNLVERESLSKKVLGQILYIARRFASKLGDYPTAEAYGKESVALFRELDDKRNLAWALRGLGGVYWERNEREHSKPFLTEAMALFQEVGDKKGVLFMLEDSAIDAFMNDDFTRGVTLINEHQTLAHELDDVYFIGWGLAILGNSEFLQGNLDKSEKLLQEGLKLIRPFGDTDGYILCLEGLVAVTDKCRQPVRSARLWGATRHLYELTGLIPSENWLHVVQEPTIASIRAQIGEAEFESAYAEGHAMTTDEAIIYALETMEA